MADPEQHVYTVSALNREVKSLLDAGLPVLWIQGEVSRIATPASGHLYFTLKDAGARVDCVMWRSAAARLKTPPRDGMQVLIRGRVGLYERDGRYQLYADHLEDAGEGLLRQRLDELRRKLDAEGLFADVDKRPLSRFPGRIGVITSPTGAAIGDVLRVLAGRCPSIPVIIYPTPVQGAEAAERIAGAVAEAAARSECDTLIVCRGGGSLEDLWCFNDERVVRAIAACGIPVVTGIGHEMDVTLADLAADLRAPTPSGAAEMASPDRRELATVIEHLFRHALTAITATLTRSAQRTDFAARRLTDLHPGTRIRTDHERLRLLSQRLLRVTRTSSRERAQRLVRVSSLLRAASPARELAPLGRRLQVDTRQLARSIDRALTTRRERLAATVHALEAVSPLATLARGYSILARDGDLIRSVSAVSPGELLSARLHDGELALAVQAVTPAGDAED
jgi:exodeoxyribonuclease VII large subunit